MDYYTPAPEEHIAREKSKARELRRSQWWKRQLAAGTCHYCGRSAQLRELTMDHVVPIVRGGRSTRSNVVPCCKECNTNKSTLVPVEWQEYLDRLNGEA